MAEETEVKKVATKKTTTKKLRTLTESIFAIQEHKFEKDAQGNRSNFVSYDEMYKVISEELKLSGHIVLTKVGDKLSTQIIKDNEVILDSGEISLKELTLISNDSKKRMKDGLAVGTSSIGDEFGALLTRFKRYQLACLLGIKTLTDKEIQEKRKVEENQQVEMDLRKEIEGNLELWKGIPEIYNEIEGYYKKCSTLDEIYMCKTKFQQIVDLYNSQTKQGA